MPVYGNILLRDKTPYETCGSNTCVGPDKEKLGRTMANTAMNRLI